MFTYFTPLLIKLDIISIYIKYAIITFFLSLVYNY